MSRWAPLLVIALLAAGAGAARADQCMNPCEVADGDVCAPMKQVIELGRSVAVRPGRQSGTCGGVAPFATDDQIVLTWSRDPAGPFTPVPFTRRGNDLLIKPDRAGAYFIEAAARDGVGEPDHLVLLVVETKIEPVTLRLRAGKGASVARTAVKVRWVPTGAGSNTFPRRRWPVWRDNDRAGHAGRPLRLPAGRYEVEWRDRARGRTLTGVSTVDVAGPGTVEVTLTPPRQVR